MEILISTILSYLVGLAGNLRTDAILTSRADKLRKQLEQKDALSKAIASARPLSDELRAACVQLAQHRDRLDVSKQEEPLWWLLSNEVFQNDLIEWFMAGGIAEGDTVKRRLLYAMEVALVESGASTEQIAFLKTGYFDALDKAVFSHPTLAHWRHQLSLDYLRKQVNELRRQADEAAGIYSPAKQKAALDHYCEVALAEWEIISLDNLPADDIDIVTKRLLLRQLYMPLRVNVESPKQSEESDDELPKQNKDNDTVLASVEEHRFTNRVNKPDQLETRCFPVGKYLGVSRRLVVLGDPGGGKTTMLRWMATAYLLRHKGDDAFKQIPDTETLPNQPWIPVLIRCRDLHEHHLGSCFNDLLTQHINKTELRPDEVKVMQTVILDHLAKGEVLLLIDGLDEIMDSQVRTMFCQELERTAARYPNAPIVVTSRIVGYRDMPYRMGAHFAHGTIAELNREDKDRFAQNWVDATEQHQPAIERAKRVKELIGALHSSDRIERLTGNPMLLTTLALVKRKVGKLPNRRNKLYAEAVNVLLNWNPIFYKVIDETEALPQLEYLAYEMCRRGVLQLSGDEVLDLLDKLRIEYPDIRAIRSREPQAFLALLEARSSILIKSGFVWQKNKSQGSPIWEFRHRSFQEYLAARALIKGRYPDRDKTKSLAEQVAPLAGVVEKKRPMFKSQQELDIPESWREVLHLLVAEAEDDDVNEVLLAILHPMPNEEAATTGRPRTVMAALCLEGEPNISKETVSSVFDAVVHGLNDYDGYDSKQNTQMDEAITSVFKTVFRDDLIHRLLDCFISGRGEQRNRARACLTLAVDKSAVTPENADAMIAATKKLSSDQQTERVLTALELMMRFFSTDGKLGFLTRDQQEVLLGNLMLALSKDEATVCAAMWVLYWLTGAIMRTQGNELNDTSNPNPTTEFIHLDATIIRKVEAILKRPNLDANTLARGCLVLTREKGLSLVFQQFDWIHALAQIADGDLPRRRLPNPRSTGRLHPIDWIKDLLSADISMRSLSSIAVTLGSFGVYVLEMVPPLRFLFTDRQRQDQNRDEALVYLGLIATPDAVTILAEAADTVPIEKDDYLYARGLFGLLLVDNVDVLAEQIRKALPHSDLNAYAYGLAGSCDPRGQVLLEQLKDHNNERVRTAVEKAFALSWMPAAKQATDNVLMSNSFTSKVCNEDKYLYKIKGVDSESNRDAWWLLRVSRNKEAIFSRIIHKGHLRLSDYGDILTSGFGKNIPPEILKQYGFKNDE